jgi:hypothetical protein
MIRPLTCLDLSESVGKWFVGTPATEAKKRKKQATAARKAQKKIPKPRTTQSKPIPTKKAQAAGESVSSSISNTADIDESLSCEDGSADSESDAEIISSDSADSGDDDNELDNDIDARPVKKAKQSEDASELDDAEITAYIEIVTPPRTVKGKPTTTSRGPFFFTPKSSYDEFLQSVAACAIGGKGVPSVTAINKAQLSWKLSVPANDRKKALSDAQGYRALIKKVIEISGKKKDSSIVVFLPPPSRVAKKVCS